MNKLKIKVCGMKVPNNMAALAKLSIDYMGLIFYPKSLRYVDSLTVEGLNILPKSIKTVGVFVNEKLDIISQTAIKYDLDCIQLHGGESVDYCMTLKNELPQTELIKVFSVACEADLKQTMNFESVCDFFLFDTKTTQHGGSGKKFDWQILDAYKGDKPFFLSGGIEPQDAFKIRDLKHSQLYAVDLNSRFEIGAGMKDIDLLKQFIEQL